MEKEKPGCETLFMLEVFLDSVYYSTRSLQIEPAKLKETCVMFDFLDYPSLVLCEEDFSKSPPKESASDEVNLTFKSGKSCMFSVSSSDIPSLPFSFAVTVVVLRKVEDKGEVNQIKIGSATIELGDSFSALIHSNMPASDLPLAKTKHGTFDILDQQQRKVGAITALIRISSFGQLIVTQFQVGATNDFMFKGTDTKKIEEIPGDSTQMPKFEVDPNYVPPPHPSKPEQGDQPPRGDEFGPAFPPTGPGFYGPQWEPPPPTPPPEEQGNYKELVAEIRGHSLHIRIPTRAKKEKEICKKQLMEGMEEGPICPFAPQLNLCDCDYPVPPEAIPRCPR